MAQPNVSEDLAEECCKKHDDDVAAIRADRYRELDTSGVDLLLVFKIKFKPNQPKVAFPMMLHLQVKTSDNLETVGVVLPVVGNRYSANNDKRISRKMRWRIKKHSRLHPLVSCMLFVSQLRDGKTRELVIEEIWRELKAIKKDIARRYLRVLEE